MFDKLFPACVFCLFSFVLLFVFKQSSAHAHQVHSWKLRIGPQWLGKLRQRTWWLCSNNRDNSTHNNTPCVSSSTGLNSCSANTIYMNFFSMCKHDNKNHFIRQAVVVHSTSQGCESFSGWLLANKYWIVLFQRICFLFVLRAGLFVFFTYICILIQLYINLYSVVVSLLSQLVRKFEVHCSCHEDNINY